MNLTLFLTSTGLPIETSPFFLKLLNRPSSDYKVAFVPTAGDPYSDKWFIKSDFDRLIELGFQVETTDLKEDKEIIKQKLIGSQIIYFSGGNTFYLLDWIRKSGLNNYLKRLLEQGRIFVGASAGSIIAGPDISISGWSPDGDTNDVKLVDTHGLNYVPFAVSPHFTETKRPMLESHLSKVDYEIISITDKQAIYYHNDQWQLVGEGESIKLNK